MSQVEENVHAAAEEGQHRQAGEEDRLRPRHGQIGQLGVGEVPHQDHGHDGEQREPGLPGPPAAQPRQPALRRPAVRNPRDTARRAVADSPTRIRSSGDRAPRPWAARRAAAVSIRPPRAGGPGARGIPGAADRRPGGRPRGKAGHPGLRRRARGRAPPAAAPSCRAAGSPSRPWSRPPDRS